MKSSSLKASNLPPLPSAYKSSTDHGSATQNYKSSTDHGSATQNYKSSTDHGSALQNYRNQLADSQLDGIDVNELDNPSSFRSSQRKNLRNRETNFETDEEFSIPLVSPGKPVAEQTMVNIPGIPKSNELTMEGMRSVSNTISNDEITIENEISPTVIRTKKVVTTYESPVSPKCSNSKSKCSTNGKKLAQSTNKSARLNSIPKCNKTEALMHIAQPSKMLKPESIKLCKQNGVETNLTKIDYCQSTAQFSTFEGIVQNQDVERALLDRGFIPMEKILTKDDAGNIVCHFIKARDKLGRAVYIELDCDYTCGMGFVSVGPEDRILAETRGASVIPYSLKVGTFEANNENLYGVGFECNGNFCVMARKDASLVPVETVFTYTRDNYGQNLGIQEAHPTPFPIVKMTEILANPQAVMNNIAISHKRMRHAVFTACRKDVESMKRNAYELQCEIDRFDKISNEVSSVLSCTIDELEN
jgi:hypothetical protein